MTLELAMKRILWIMVCLVGAALPGCKPSAVDDPIGDVPPAGTPLPQRSEIPVEVRVGDEWMTVKLSQEALEQFAAQWCLAENVQRADRTLCGTHRFFDDLLVTHIPSEPVVSSPDAFNLCHQGLCVQRVHTCAGYFLEEISRTPTPKRLTPQDVERSHFSVSELALSASDVERLGQVSSRAQMSEGISEVRFQPLKSDAKAAALRGALNQYRHSTQWSRLFATMQVEDASGNFTCAARFAAQDYQYLTAGQGQGTGLQPNERGREPTWSDVLLQSYLDASNQYSRAISLTTDAMRAAAQVQIDGGNAAPDEAATAWNGQVNSAVAVARLLTMAPSQSTVIQPGPGVHTLGLAGCGAQEEGGGRLGPTGVPVCPPISGNDRIQISIDLIRGMQVAPNANAADSIAQILRFYQGLTYQGTDEVLQEQGVSRADISLAVDYLCAEAALEG
ncbi:MAG: hypothetical protein KF915_22090, partial [Polyangiaceae bacterium]|nr:hypothetical protein [Polyangiaceae bacterium]